MTTRLIRLLVTSVAAAGSMSCIQSAEPTPSSTLIKVDPERTAVHITNTQYTSFFEVPVHFTNTSSQVIYIDAPYRAVEKLIDQKWKLATENSPPPFSSTSTLAPGRETRYTVIVSFNPQQTSATPLLEDLRGLYRIRFRMAFDSRGTQPLPPEAGISKPFAVAK